MSAKKCSSCWFRTGPAALYQGCEFSFRSGCTKLGCKRRRPGLVTSGPKCSFFAADADEAESIIRRFAPDQGRPPKEHKERVQLKVSRRPCGFDKERALELWRQGLNDGQIGEAVGTNRNNIFAWRKRNGMAANALPCASNRR